MLTLREQHMVAALDNAPMNTLSLQRIYHSKWEARTQGLFLRCTDRREGPLTGIEWGEELRGVDSPIHTTLRKVWDSQ